MMLNVSVHSRPIRFCIFLLPSTFVRKFSSVCIFIYTVSYSSSCYVNNPFNNQKVFIRPKFLFAKTYVCTFCMYFGDKIRYLNHNIYYDVLS